MIKDKTETSFVSLLFEIEDKSGLKSDEKSEIQAFKVTGGSSHKALPNWLKCAIPATSKPSEIDRYVTLLSAYVDQVSN
jgi:hypothetical protein